MKKFILTVAKTPLFFLRWINAAIMRFIPASVMLLAIYQLIQQFLYKVDVSDMYEVYTEPFFTVAILISIIWGFLFTLTKPPVYKIAYIFRGKRVFGRSIFGRVLMGILYVIILQSPMFSIRVLALYCLVEIIINTYILSKSKMMPYNEALEKLCFGEEGK